MLSAVALAAPASVEWGAAGHAFIDITAIVSRQEVGGVRQFVCVRRVMRSKRCRGFCASARTFCRHFHLLIKNMQNVTHTFVTSSWRYLGDLDSRTS